MGEEERNRWRYVALWRGKVEGGWREGGGREREGGGVNKSGL